MRVLVVLVRLLVVPLVVRGVCGPGKRGIDLQPVERKRGNRRSRERGPHQALECGTFFDVDLIEQFIKFLISHRILPTDLRE